jgi:hypothetical protein
MTLEAALTVAYLACLFTVRDSFGPMALRKRS